MREAVRDNWSASRLVRAVQAQVRHRRAFVGRDPRVPDDPTEQLLHLDALAEKWCRWCQAAESQLPADLVDQIARATRAVRQVQDAVARKLQPPAAKEAQAAPRRRTAK